MTWPERLVLETLEEAAATDPTALPVQLTFLAADGVGIDPGELAAARRRAMLVLAAGGDPYRDLGPDARAVVSLAEDLASPERRAALTRALFALRAHAQDLPRATAALEALIRDPESAWLWFACAQLAEELADDA
jgi:hypothetical protein